MSDRPRLRQVGCVTCGQIMEDFERKLKCPVCNVYIHDACFETLYMGNMWSAEMCLTCQHKADKEIKSGQ